MNNSNIVNSNIIIEENTSEWKLNRKNIYKTQKFSIDRIKILLENNQTINGTLYYNNYSTFNNISILVHGLNSSESLMDNLFYEISTQSIKESNGAIITFDMPGCGNSDYIENYLSISLEINILYNLITFFDKYNFKNNNNYTEKQERHFSILGASIGGLIASQVASLHTSTIDHLILLSPYFDASCFSYIFSKALQLFNYNILRKIINFQSIGTWLNISKEDYEKELNKKFIKDIKNISGKSSTIICNEKNIKTLLIYSTNDKVLEKCHFNSYKKYNYKNTIVLILNKLEHSYNKNLDLKERNLLISTVVEMLK